MSALPPESALEPQALVLLPVSEQERLVLVSPLRTGVDP